MSGGVRRAAFILPTIITIVVIALAGTALLQQRQVRSERLAEAEKVGAAYFSDVATFEAEVQRELNEVRSGDPAELKKVVDENLKQPPVLGPAPEGAEDSKTYRAAVEAEPTVLEPYESLSSEARPGRRGRGLRQGCRRTAGQRSDRAARLRAGVRQRTAAQPRHPGAEPVVGRVPCRQGAQGRPRRRGQGRGRADVRHQPGREDGRPRRRGVELRVQLRHAVQRRPAGRAGLRDRDRRRRRRGARPDPRRKSRLRGGSRIIGTWSMPASSKFSPERT